ncbi:MAG: hypothetical protein WCI04_00790 [archaeon]
MGNKKNLRNTHTRPRYVELLIQKLKAKQSTIETANKAHRSKRKKSLVFPGPAVHSLVDSFKGSNKLDHAIILARLVSKIPVYKVPNEFLIKNYANRTAEEIIRSNAIFEANDSIPIKGCVDHAHVLVASLTAMGLPARFVRWGNHSMAKFSFGGKDFFLDVDRILRKKGSPLRPIEGDEARAIEMLKKENLYKEGRDARNIGLDYSHFYHSQMH